MEGVVVSKVRYNDNTLIVNVISAQEGKKAYLKRISKRSKDYLYFEHLNLIDFKTAKTGKNKWEQIKDVSLIFQYPKNNSFKTNSLRYFISEFLNLTIQDQEENIELFNFIKSTIFSFSEESNNLILDFLFNISKIKGFYIPSEENNFFDLIESDYCKYKPLHNNYLSKKDLKSIHKYCNGLNLVSIEKKQAFYAILKFYSFHYQALNNMKSLEVIREVAI